MRFLLLLLLAGAAPACRYTLEVDGPDGDGDGFGEQVDCDDGDADVSPGESEVPYNGVDDDCDEATPDDDLDGDGHVAASDCDDTDASRHPDAAEVCNGLDDDCDEVADDAVAGQWYEDDDGDGYGDPATATTTCAPGSGLVDLGGDCADGDATIHPGAEEDCAAVDRNCDGSPDQGVPLEEGASMWYADADDDGFGDATAPVSACAIPDGYVADATDCDDTPTTGAGVHTGAAETCDGVDQDCDEQIDEGAGDRVAYHLDDDADGYGDPDLEVLACAQPAGYVADGTDCDDLDALTHPEAAEICDGKSNDCDGQVDEEASGRTTFFPDDDGDGFGDSGAPGVLACTAPADHVANDLDCDDNATDGEDAFPGGVEVCDDDLDNDCDGTVDNAFDAFPWYRDADQDTFGDPTDVKWACAEPVGYVDVPYDCDDTEDAPGVINPDGVESCNGVDDDCDGFVDDIAQGANGTTGGTRWYLDIDADGYSDESVFRDACAQPTGYLADSASVDCDETDPDVNPGEASQCDGLDRNCDGWVDGDDDHDGFPGGGDCPAAPDCNDGSTSIWPGQGGCSGGASCLEILELWDIWGFSIDSVAGDPATWTIDGATSGTREVVCDLVDDGDRPSAGWTRVYFQDFSSIVDGWQVDDNWNLSSPAAATRSTTACAGRAVLGPYPPGDPAGLAILFKDVSTDSIPHTHAWLDMTAILIDDWESSDIFYATLEDRFVWDEGHVAGTPSGGNPEICDNVFTDNSTDLVVEVHEGILHEDVLTDPNLLVMGVDDGSQTTDEGFAIDDVAVWVR